MFSKISEIRNNIPIRNRIIALEVIISTFVVVVVILLLFTISSAHRNVLDNHKSNTDDLFKISEFIENIYGVIIKSHIISENTLSEDLVDYALQIDLLDVYLNNFRKDIDASQKEIYDKLLYEADNYVAIIKEINSLELQGRYDKVNAVKINKELHSFNKLHDIIEQLLKANNNKIEQTNKKIRSLERYTFRKIYISGSLLLVLIIVLFSLTFSGLKVYADKLYDNTSKLNVGQIPEKQLQINENELGRIAHLVNVVISKMFNLTMFANSLTESNYNVDSESIKDTGVLGDAMVSLRNTLKLKQEEETKRKSEENIRNWTNSGHTLFGEILRQRSQGIKPLTDDIIKNLVNYLEANQGGLFTINDNEIELISAFAYDRKKFIERKIKMGDGLVGTVALEKNTIFLDEIPKDYIEIESGLGDASPKNLLIVPLNFEDEILGVVEIASFKTIKPHEIKFVEELGQSIASTLLTVKINARTEQLLNESQKQSNELALREIEARSNLEKIKAAQELAKVREADLTGILSAVDNTLMKGEYELDGTLISVNDRHLQTMGYQLREIKGKNIEIFIPDKELEEFRRIWKSVAAGVPRQIEVERRTKKGDVLWLVNQYTPVTDASGEISKILYLAHDVTHYKIGEGSIQHAEQKENKLKAKKLKDEIEKRKADLKKIAKEISKLKEEKKDFIEKNTDNEVDKKYSEWLNSVCDKEGKS